MKPKITLEYCPKCHWLLRSAWMAQELLTTFEAELSEVSLRAGSFKVLLNEGHSDRKKIGD
jgi:selenoprotein W-related protein